MGHSSSAVYHRQVSEPSELKRRQAKLPAAIAAKLDNNQTVELDTADFDELGQVGEVATRTVALTRSDLEEFDPHVDHAGAEPKVVIALEADAAPRPPTLPTIEELPRQTPGERDIRTQYVGRVSVENMMAPAAPNRYRALIITIYLLVGAILAISIYYRFG